MLSLQAAFLLFQIQFHIHNTGICNKLPAFTGSCLALQI